MSIVNAFCKVSVVFVAIGTLSSTNVYGQAGSSDMNYVKETSTLIEGLSETDVSNVNSAGIAVKITYIDELGRPQQIIGVKNSPQGNDLVQPVIYDQFGREAVKVLPYASQAGNGEFRSNATGNISSSSIDGLPLNYSSSEQFGFYNGIGTGVALDTHPYAVTRFENSPLSRVSKQGAAGLVWQPNASETDFSDKSVKISYHLNGTNEVIRWTYDSETMEISSGAGTSLGYYAADMLFVKRTFDETNNETVEYTDKEGQVVCKKVQYKSLPDGTPAYAQTYYIFDDFGNLVAVFPPEAIDRILKVLSGN